MDGFWDHPLEERGLLFAPVRFRADWGRRAFVPQFTVNCDFLMGALFVRTSFHHYFFGDYFEDRYEKRGFVSWPDYRWGKVGFDPNYSYYRHLHAGDPHWETSLHDLYHGRRSGEVPRPPHTWSQQVEAVRKIEGENACAGAVHTNLNFTHLQNVSALTTLKDVHNVRTTQPGRVSRPRPGEVTSRPIALQKVAAEEHARQLKAAEQMRTTATQRRELEGEMLSQGRRAESTHGRAEADEV